MVLKPGVTYAPCHCFSTHHAVGGAGISLTVSQGPLSAKAASTCRLTLSSSSTIAKSRISPSATAVAAAATLLPTLQQIGSSLTTASAVGSDTGSSVLSVTAVIAKQGATAGVQAAAGGVCGRVGSTVGAGGDVGVEAQAFDAQAGAISGLLRTAATEQPSINFHLQECESLRWSTPATGGATPADKYLEAAHVPGSVAMVSEQVGAPSVLSTPRLQVSGLDGVQPWLKIRPEPRSSFANLAAKPAGHLMQVGMRVNAGVQR